MEFFRNNGSELCIKLRMMSCYVIRHQTEGESDPQLNLSGHGLMPMSEVNNSSVWKQVLNDSYSDFILKHLMTSLRNFPVLLRFENMKKRFCSCGNFLLTIQSR